MPGDAILFEDTKSGRPVTLSDFIRNAVQEKINAERLSHKIDSSDEKRMVYKSPSGNPLDSWNEFVNIIETYIVDSKDQVIDYQLLKVAIKKHTNVSFESSSKTQLGHYNLTQEGLKEDLDHLMSYSEMSYSDKVNLESEPKISEMFKHSFLRKTSTKIALESIKENTKKLISERKSQANVMENYDQKILAVSKMKDNLFDVKKDKFSFKDLNKPLSAVSLDGGHQTKKKAINDADRYIKLIQDSKLLVNKNPLSESGINTKESNAYSNLALLAGSGQLSSKQKKAILDHVIWTVDRYFDKNELPTTDQLQEVLFKEALLNNPDNLKARINLGILHHKSKDPQVRGRGYEKSETDQFIKLIARQQNDGQPSKSSSSEISNAYFNLSILAGNNQLSSKQKKAIVTKYIWFDKDQQRQLNKKWVKFTPDQLKEELLNEALIHNPDSKKAQFELGILHYASKDSKVKDRSAAKQLLASFAHLDSRNDEKTYNIPYAEQFNKHASSIVQDRYKGDGKNKIVNQYDKINTIQSVITADAKEIIRTEHKKLQDEEQKGIPCNQFINQQIKTITELHDSLKQSGTTFYREMAESQFYLGYLEHSRGNYSQALTHYQKADDHLLGSHFRAKHNMAHIYDQQGKHHKAADKFIELIQMNESSGVNVLKKGDQPFHFHEHAGIDASITREQELTVNTSKSNAYLNLAVIAGNGQLSSKQKKTIFDNYISNNKNDISQDEKPKLYKEWVKSTPDQLKEKLLKQALVYNPDNMKARFNLGALYYSSKDRKVKNLDMARALLAPFANSEHKEGFDIQANPHFHGSKMKASEYSYANSILASMANEKGDHQKFQEHALNAINSKHGAPRGKFTKFLNTQVNKAKDGHSI